MKRFLSYLHPAALLLLTFVAIPVGFNVEKGVLVAVALLFVFTEIGLGKAGRLRLDRGVAAMFLLSLTTGLGFLLLGAARNNPGANFSTMIYLVWPTVYMIFVLRFSSFDSINLANKIIILGGLVASALIVNQYMFYSGLISENMYIQLDKMERVSIQDGYFHSSSTVVSTLIFIIPFLMANVFAKTQLFEQNKTIVWVTLIASVIAMLLGGRRAGILVMVSVPLVLIFIHLIESKNSSSKLNKGVINIVLLVVVVLASMYYVVGTVANWSVEGQIAMVLDGFAFDSSESAIARRDQARALLDGWSASPVFGVGFGAVAEGSIRSSRPWEYELQYLLLLFHTGIVGFCLYSSGILWIVYNLWKVKQNNSFCSEYSVPYLIGILGFIFANATNPYYQAYGHLWTIFLPLAFINVSRLSGAPRRRRSAKVYVEHAASPPLAG